MDIYSDSHADRGPDEPQGEDVLSSGTRLTSAESTDGIRVAWCLALAYFIVGVAALFLF